MAYYHSSAMVAAGTTMVTFGHMTLRTYEMKPETIKNEHAEIQFVAENFRHNATFYEQWCHEDRFYRSNSLMELNGQVFFIYKNNGTSAVFSRSE